MELKIPTPEQAYWGLRAMKTVAMANGRFAEAERHMLRSIQSVGSYRLPTGASPAPTTNARTNITPAATVAIPNRLQSENIWRELCSGLNAGYFFLSLSIAAWSSSSLSERIGCVCLPACISGGYAAPKLLSMPYWIFHEPVVDAGCAI